MATFNISGHPSNFCYDLLEINVESLDSPEKPKSIFGYNESLNNYRNTIDKIQPDIWKNARWIINNHDFTVKGNIINRAFYKYWEIIQQFNIFSSFSPHDLILHGAEAPGGFIQGSSIFLKKYFKDLADLKEQDIFNSNDQDDNGFTIITNKKKKSNKYKIFSISLNNKHNLYKSIDLPSYNKSILQKHVFITYGVDNTGDINKWENIMYISKLTKNKPFYLITADGGFDEGKDFNNKEQLHYSLILSELFLAIQLQKDCGHFVLKMFDIFTETSIHFLYFLTFCYDEVYIYKPHTSRPTNSEKYIICKGFKLNSTERTNMLKILNHCKHLVDSINKKFISISLFKSIPEYFTQLIYDTNSSLLNTQCDYLQQAISLSSNTNFCKNISKDTANSLQARQSVFERWSSKFNFET